MTRAGLCAIACVGAIGASGAASLLGGCAVSETNGVPNGIITKSVSRVAPGQTGLEVVRWQIQDDGQRMEDALRKHSAPAVAIMDDAALRKNGFVVWAVKRADLEALLTDMGGSYMDVRTWFGQVTSWREVSSTQLGNAMLEIDGVAHERPGAVTRLMLRSWPLPMEDGTRIAVELVPQVVMDAEESSLLRHGETLGGQVVSSCAAELELDREIAWVVTCDPSRQIELKMPSESMPNPEVALSEPPPAETMSPPAVAPAEAAQSGAASPEDAPPEAAPPEATAPAPTPAPTSAPSPAPKTGTARVPPAPPLQAAPAQPVRPRARPPLNAPPLETPPPPTSKKLVRAFAWLPAMALGVQSEPAAASKPAFTRARVVTLGVQLLLATPEGAGVNARRTVLVLVPHLDSSPFPAPVNSEPISVVSTP